jgi:hypothetical protein
MAILLLRLLRVRYPSPYIYTVGDPGVVALVIVSGLALARTSTLGRTWQNTVLAACAGSLPVLLDRRTS